MFHHYVSTSFKDTCTFSLHNPNSLLNLNILLYKKKYYSRKSLAGTTDEAPTHTEANLP
jgi:hypothetical protein